MKRHVIVIHGGDAWNTYEEYLEYLKNYNFTQENFDRLQSKRWKDFLQRDLGDAFIVVALNMPSTRNAKYEEWAIWFEKIFPYLHEGAIFVGHSLGANFLATYFSKNNIPRTISQIHLVAGCYGAAGGFTLPVSLRNIEKQCNDIFIYHATDDPVVPHGDAVKYHTALPHAQLLSFTDRGHFLQESFPEIVDNIKKCV